MTKIMNKDEIIDFCNRIQIRIEKNGLKSRPISDVDRNRFEEFQVASSTSNIDIYDPVLTSMIRRSMAKKMR